MAWYDLEDFWSILSREYLGLRVKLLLSYKAFMGSLTLNDRRVYEALDVDEPWT